MEAYLDANLWKINVFFKIKSLINERKSSKYKALNKQPSKYQIRYKRKKFLKNGLKIQSVWIGTELDSWFIIYYLSKSFVNNEFG